MKKLYSILIILFASIAVHAQPYETNPDFKRTFNWLFGAGVWLDFNHNPPQNKDGSQLSTIEASASYSDEDGNLLLYSDGLTIWNGNHNIILNGTGIDGHQSSSQGAVFVKMPGNDSLVYLFTTDHQCNNKGFKYSIVLLHADMDSFSVTEKNIPIISDVTETIAVTEHQNNTDVWIVVRKSYGKEFCSLLLTAEGLIKCPVISTADRDIVGNNFRCQTKSKFNDKGDQYVFVSSLNGYMEVYSFDNSKGVLSNSNFVKNLNIPTGVEFTTNDTFLYFLERDSYVRRLNTYSGLDDTIYNVPSPAFLMIGMLRGINNVIYINILNSDTLAIISDLEKNSPVFILKGHGTNKKLTNDLPNFNQSYFYTPPINFMDKTRSTQIVIVGSLLSRE